MTKSEKKSKAFCFYPGNLLVRQGIGDSFSEFIYSLRADRGYDKAITFNSDGLFTACFFCVFLFRITNTHYINRL